MISNIIRHFIRRLGRALVPLRIRLAYLLSRNPLLTQNVLLLDPWTVIKTTSIAQSQQEAAAHAFIHQHTSVPVPVLFDSWTDDCADIGYLRFSVVPGELLETAWPMMTLESQARTATELRAYIAEIRALQQKPTPVGWIGSVGKKGVICPRIGMHGHPCGPWESEAEFNAFLLKPLDHCKPGDWQRSLGWL